MTRESVNLMRREGGGRREGEEEKGKDRVEKGER